MRIATAFFLCVLLATPVCAQQSQERQNLERKATFFLWTGVSVAAAGIMPMMAGYKSIAVPFLAGGGGLIYYAFQLNNKAKQLPSTTFTVVPVRRGAALVVARSW